MAPAATRQGVRENESTRSERQRNRSARSARDAAVNDAERLGEEVGAFEGAAHNIANDVNALVQAWSEANAEIFKGVVSVVGNLAVDLNDSVGLRGRRVVSARRSARSNRRDERDGDVDDAEDTADSVTRVTRSLADAVKETANIVQRSGQRFQQRFEQAERPYEDDDEQDTHGRRRDRARSETQEVAESARDRQFKETTEQREQDVAADQRSKPPGKPGP